MKRLLIPTIALMLLAVATPAQAREHGCSATTLTSGVMASGSTSCAFAQRIAVTAAKNPAVRSTRSFSLRVVSPVTHKRYALTCERASGTDEVMCENKARGIWAWFDVGR